MKGNGGVMADRFQAVLALKGLLFPGGPGARLEINMNSNWGPKIHYKGLPWNKSTKHR